LHAAISGGTQDTAVIHIVFSAALVDMTLSELHEFLYVPPFSQVTPPPYAGAPDRPRDFCSSPMEVPKYFPKEKKKKKRNTFTKIFNVEHRA
jgi:hypothetical protein